MLLNLWFFFYLPSTFLLPFCPQRRWKMEEMLLWFPTYTLPISGFFSLTLLPMFPQNGCAALTVAYKVKHPFILWRSNSTLRCLPIISENICPQKDLNINVFINVYSSFIHIYPIGINSNVHQKMKRYTNYGIFAKQNTIQQLKTVNYGFM